MNETDQPSTPDENTTLTANALKAMAHPLRWKILCSLGDKELSVGEIVSKTGTSQSNISQHLEQLRNKNRHFSQRGQPDLLPYSQRPITDANRHHARGALPCQSG